MESEAVVKQIKKKMIRKADYDTGVWLPQQYIEVVLKALDNSISKKIIEDKINTLELLKRHISLEDKDRKIFDICIDEIKKLLEDRQEQSNS